MSSSNCLRTNIYTQNMKETKNFERVEVTIDDEICFVVMKIRY